MWVVYEAPPKQPPIGPYRLLKLKYPDATNLAIGGSNNVSLKSTGLRTRDAVEKIGFKVNIVKETDATFRQLASKGDHVLSIESWQSWINDYQDAYSKKRTATLKIDDAVYLKEGQTAYLARREDGRVHPDLVDDAEVPVRRRRVGRVLRVGGR